ncbi:MAG: LUD domain-containing protein [Elusimicrobiota bacterium]|nr:LUD domain-containing protein [Elusimicrobiota bacterium]
MDEYKNTISLKTLENTAAALRRNNFEAAVYESGPAAAAALLSLAGTGKKIGVGGSITVSALGLPEALAAAGNTIVTHSPGMNAEARRSTWLAAQAADIYLASPQAVTLDGKLIFLDANGNRGAAVICGPRKIVLLAGINKIARNQEEGLWRARNVAAAGNNLRLKKDNPCVKTGKCEDCASPQRICNAVTLLWKKPWPNDVLVMLINEDLGY